MSEPSPNGNPPSLARSVGWSALGQFGAQAVGFVANLLLAIPLGPQEFGIIGFAWAVMLLFDALVDFGTGTALVQRRELPAKVVDTAFTINVALAAVAGLGVAAIGALVHDWTGHEGRPFDGITTARVLWLLAPACIATSLGGIHRALLQRALRFAAIAKVQLAAALVRAGTSLALAFAGHGAQALVIGYLASHAVSITGYWLCTRARLHFGWDRDEGRALLRFGLHLTVFNLLHTALQRVDAFLLSLTLGQTDFGLFTLTRQLLLQTVDIAGMVSRTTLLPHLSRLQGRVRRSRAVYLRTDQTLLVLMAPMLIATALLIGPLAHACLPAKWAPVGSLAPMLLPAALVTLLLQNPGSTMVANDRTAAMPVWGLWRGLPMVLASVAGAFLSLDGVALALGALLLLTLPPLLTEPARILHCRRRTMFASLGTVVLPAAAATAATVALRDALLARGVADLLVVALGGSACCAVFALAAWLLRIPALQPLRRRLHQRRAAHSSA